MKKIASIFIISFAGLMLNAQHRACVSWLNNNLVPIKSLKAGNGMEDLKKLDGFIGDTRIVGLGEFTHGSKEVFTMKHRMLEYLVKEKGFTIFAIEANMPEAYKLNDYIINGKGNAKELLGGMYFWTWYTQEVLDMIEWMKQYNDTSSKKIYFTGFDMQFYKTALTNVKAFFTKYDIPFAEKITAFDSTASKLVYKLHYDNSKAAAPLVEIATDILNEFESSARAKQDADYAWIKQNITILWQYALSNTQKQSRDESMAQNVQWIAEQNPGSKIVLWAHNGHIHKKKYWMGKFLEQKFGDNYLSLGFAGEAGTYTAFNRNNNRNKLDSANALSASNKKDYEYYLRAASIDNYFLVLNQITLNKQNEFLFDKKYLRHIGARVEEGKRQFGPTNLQSEYDGLIFIRNSSSSRCFLISK